MPEKRIRFVIVSKNEDFMFNNENIRDFMDKNSDISERISFDLIANNHKSLTTVYNENLEEEKNSGIRNDFMVFMHADVTMDFRHLIEHMIACEEKYDVMGLCGCQKISSSESPLNWFTGSRQYPEFRWGCVTHGEDRNHTSFFSSNRRSIDNSPVACIDGLCIIFTRKAIESGLKFDERFEYDFYDTDISFSAQLEHKLRVGVIVEESLQHYSLGKSILTDDFLKHEVDFRNKWKLEFPEGSKVKEFLESTKNG